MTRLIYGVLVALLFFVGCGAPDTTTNETKTASYTVTVMPLAVTADNRQAAAAGLAATRLDLTVSNNGTVVATKTANWDNAAPITLTLTLMPRDYTFDVKIFNTNNELALTGSALVTRPHGTGATVLINLVPYNAASAPSVPSVGVSRPATVEAGQTGQISIKVSGKPGQVVFTSIAAPVGWGVSADPQSGTLDAWGGRIFQFGFKAPAVAGTGLFTARVTGPDVDGVAIDYTITVVDPAVDYAVVLNAAPVIGEASFTVKPEGLSVTVSVVDEGPVSYLWSYTGSLPVHGALTDTALLLGYGESSGGTLTLRVTDQHGAATERSYVLTPGQFSIENAVSDPTSGQGGNTHDVDLFSCTSLPAGSFLACNDFTTSAPGPYDVADVYREWLFNATKGIMSRDGIGDNSDTIPQRATIIENSARNRQLEVLIPAESCGTTDGAGCGIGGGAQWNSYLNTGYEELTFEYDFRLDDTDPFKQIKLPAITSAPFGNIISGGDPVNGCEGATIQPGLRDSEEIFVNLYTVDKQATQWGENLRTGHRITPGSWHRLRLTVRMNTADNADGIVRLELDGAQILDARRRIRSSADTCKMPMPIRWDGVYVSVLYGGNTTEYAPTADKRILFDNLLVTTPPPQTAPSPTPTPPPITPTPSLPTETLDGLDNDGDGSVDEDFKVALKRLHGSNGFGCGNPAADFDHCLAERGTCIGGQPSSLSYLPDGTSITIYGPISNQGVTVVGSMTLAGLYACTNMVTTEHLYLPYDHPMLYDARRSTLWSCSAEPIGYAPTNAYAGATPVYLLESLSTSSRMLGFNAAEGAECGFVGTGIPLFYAWHP
jgi:hypothetical protein